MRSRLQVGDTDHVVVRHRVGQVLRGVDREEIAPLRASRCFIGGTKTFQKVEIFPPVCDVLIVDDLAQPSLGHRVRFVRKVALQSGQKRHERAVPFAALPERLPFRGRLFASIRRARVSGFEGPDARVHPPAVRPDNVDVVLARKRQNTGSRQRPEHRRRDDAAVLQGQRVHVEDDLALGRHSDGLGHNRVIGNPLAGRDLLHDRQ